MDEQFRYDVFISYSWADKDWVRNHLDPALRAAGLRVCLDVRDFTPGAPLLREMERAIRESRRTVCVYTPDARSGRRAVMLEQLMAGQLALVEGESRVIPLRLRETDLPLWLGGALPIEWTDPQAYPLEWGKLLGALQAPSTDAPPPGPPGAPPPPEPEPVPFRWEKLVVGALAVSLVVAPGVWFISRQMTRELKGKIFYVKKASQSFPEPVNHVNVFVNGRPELRGETNADGEFTFNVPAALNVTHLGGEYGGLPLPVFERTGEGQYFIVPRLPVSLGPQPVTEQWGQAPPGDCPEAEEAWRFTKRYVLTTSIPGDEGLRRTYLHVSVTGSGDARIQSAYILEPHNEKDSQGKYLYTRWHEGERESEKVHATWQFNVPAGGLRTVRVGVCVESNQSEESLSPAPLSATLEPIKEEK